jgi:hypothetical protein
MLETFPISGDRTKVYHNLMDEFEYNKPQSVEDRVINLIEIIILIMDVFRSERVIQNTKQYHYLIFRIENRLLHINETKIHETINTLFYKMILFEYFEKFKNSENILISNYYISKCIICDDFSEVTFTPCGHQVLCSCCANNYEKHSSQTEYIMKCAVCRNCAVFDAELYDLW